MYIALIIIIIILLLWSSQKEYFGSKYKTIIGPAVGDESYVKFYGDFDHKDLVFQMMGAGAGESKPRFFKYIWRGDVRSMDINLLNEGPAGNAETGPRRARIWAYRFYSPVGTTLTDFYNIYQIPEHDYRAHPNLQLVADVKPGERVQTDNVPFSKRFLVELVL